MECPAPLRGSDACDGDRGWGESPGVGGGDGGAGWSEGVRSWVWGVKGDGKACLRKQCVRSEPGRTQTSLSLCSEDPISAVRKRSPVPPLDHLLTTPKCGTSSAHTWYCGGDRPGRRPP